MAKAAITEQYLTDIADAIRSKTGLNNVSYYPSEMASAIMTISGSGGITPAGTISITENGTYNVSQYIGANVNVPIGSEINNQTKIISPSQSIQNITYDSGYTGLSTVTINAIPSTYVGSGITVNPTPTVSGDTITIPSGYYSSSTSKSVASGTAGTPTATKGIVSNHAVTVTPSVTNTTGYILGGTKTGTGVSVAASELVSGTKSISANGTGIDVVNYASVDVAISPSLQTKSATPTESAQTISPDSGYDGLSSVSVGAIDSEYVGSDITRRSSTDLTASGATVSVPAGYYESAASKAISNGSAATPATTVTANPSLSINSSTGVVSASVSATKSVTPTVSAGYVSSGTAGTITVSGSDTLTLSTQAAATITPSTSQQTAVAAGKYTTGNVVVSAMPSGSAGTPTATKGTVSNHAITVTPSVTNTTGYITGGTKTGTAVTVSASELVSGSETKTENGTYDVTNLASLVVNVSGSGSSSWTKIAEASYQVNTTSTSAGTVETLATGHSEIWTSDKWVFVRVRDTVGKRNGYFYGSDNLFWNNALVNGNTYTSVTSSFRIYTTYNDNVFSTTNGSGTTGYGVYADTVYSDGRVRIRRRYNSSYTHTINSTYKVEVYLLDPPGGIPIFA